MSLLAPQQLPLIVLVLDLVVSPAVPQRHLQWSQLLSHLQLVELQQLLLKPLPSSRQQQQRRRGSQQQVEEGGAPHLPMWQLQLLGWPVVLALHATHPRQRSSWQQQQKRQGKRSSSSSCCQMAPIMIMMQLAGP